MAIVLDPANGVTFNDLSLQGAAASPYVLKNRIINGAMVIDQRNAGASSVPATSSYTYTSVDRFFTSVNSPATSTAIQSTSAPTGFTTSLKIGRSGTGTAGLNTFGQVIETNNSQDLAGSTVTLSFWAKVGASATFSTMSASIFSGTVANQTAATLRSGWTGQATVANNSSIALTTTWQQFSITGSVGASAVQLAVQFVFTTVGAAGADDNVYITGVQLEVGSTATPFERRLYNQELANCQRYYYKYWVNYSNTARVALVGAYNATRAFGGMSTPVPMRTTPTLSYGSNTYFQLETLNLASSYAVTSFAIFAVNNTFSNNNYSVEIDVASGLTAGSVYHVSLLNTSGTATLGYYDFSAEL